MSNLPAPWEGGRPSRQLARAVKAQEQTALEIYAHELIARREAECDRIDSQAAGDAARAALECEFDLLSWGLEKAGSSAAMKELVARHVAQLSRNDLRRLARRFGE
jgi:hypothetical protein